MTSRESSSSSPFISTLPISTPPIEFRRSEIVTYLRQEFCNICRHFLPWIPSSSLYLTAIVDQWLYIQLVSTPSTPDPLFRRPEVIFDVISETSLLRRKLLPVCYRPLSVSPYLTEKEARHLLKQEELVLKTMLSYIGNPGLSPWIIETELIVAPPVAASQNAVCIPFPRLAEPEQAELIVAPPSMAPQYVVHIPPQQLAEPEQYRDLVHQYELVGPIGPILHARWTLLHYFSSTNGNKTNENKTNENKTNENKSAFQILQPEKEVINTLFPFLYGLIDKIAKTFYDLVMQQLHGLMQYQQGQMTNASPIKLFVTKRTPKTKNCNHEECLHEEYGQQDQMDISFLPATSRMLSRTDIVSIPMHVYRMHKEKKKTGSDLLSAPPVLAPPTVGTVYLPCSDLLYCMARRYTTLSSSFSSSISPRLISVLRHHLKIHTDLCTSPFSTLFSSYSSFFPDVDKDFGSSGCVMNHPFVSGSYVCHPPAIEEVALIIIMRLLTWLADRPQSIARTHIPAAEDVSSVSMALILPSTPTFQPLIQFVESTPFLVQSISLFLSPLLLSKSNTRARATNGNQDYKQVRGYCPRQESERRTSLYMNDLHDLYQNDMHLIILQNANGRKMYAYDHHQLYCDLSM